MYQLAFERGNAEEFRAFVRNIAKRVSVGEKALFHLYNDTAKRDVTDEAIGILNDEMPDSVYVGCSTSGNICNGSFVKGDLPNLTVICNVYESADTRIEVHQLPLREDCKVETAESFLKLIEERPWVKAVEMLTTIIDVSMYDFCSRLSEAKREIVFFGGGALCTETVDMFSGLPYVFSKDGDSDGHAVASVLYGGDDFHAITRAVFGWKPLGRSLSITKAQGSVIYELDGVPAFERYRHYLKVENDDHFSDNSLVFPLMVDQGDNYVIKAPVKVGDDGSLTVTSDLSPQDVSCRIAYGDPATILNSIKDAASAIAGFFPQAIYAYSCAGRFSYWGPNYISGETLPLDSIAPTVGFYTGGEFERDCGRVVHHNVTLVMVGLREGDATADEVPHVTINEAEFSRQMAIVNSLAAFVGVTSAELEEAYARMRYLAKVDGLTGINNRLEIETRIEASVEQANADEGGSGYPCLAMFDVDDFKKVNDVYGHKAGDDVLKELGSILRRHVDDLGIGSSGRWGGEEFIVLLPDATIEEAEATAQGILESFRAVDFALSGIHGMSVGVAQALPEETSDLLCQRVDKALYAAKKAGKNRVVLA